MTGFLRSVPSVRLFLDRAADVVPDFALTAENAPAIARLCRTLDGLPLAVELAAARLQALPVAEIEARLGDRFRLLAAGRRTVPRHRTLQAVVAWSWDLLTGAEQVLARRFTVFAGSADLDAIEKVCRTPDDRTGYRTDDGEDVVEVLAGLVAKSLIERDGPRYRMLATIRAFCAAHLTDSGERDRLYHAHADHFLALALRAGPFLRSADQLGWLVRLDADRDNLQAAVRRSTAHGAPGTALRLVSALCFYWWLRGLRLEAAALSDLVLRVIGPEPPPGLVEEYVVGVFTAALGSGPVMPAARWSAYLLSLSTAPAQPFLLYLSAMAVGPPDSDPAGIAELNRRLRDQVAGDPWCRALGGIGGGWVVLFSGADPALAEPEFRAALDGFRVLGDRWGAMLALSGLAELAVWRADPAAAIPPTVEALRLAGELGSTIDVADLLRGRGQARMDTGDLEGAAADFSRAAELAREAGAPEMVAAALLGLGSLAMTRGGAAALAEASRHCRAALSACPSGWYSADGIRMTVLVMLGRIAESSGDPAAARARYREVFTVRSGIIGLPVMVEALERLAALTADPVHAARLLGAAHTLGSRAGAGVLPAAAFAEGSGLSPEQITALVRADIRP
ncbi:MAG TPA: hypothetical protein VN408_18550 [Actinoplanes sp.]|nr:hypothetical protein [Actinoplanes sp.]